MDHEIEFLPYFTENKRNLLLLEEDTQAPRPCVARLIADLTTGQDRVLCGVPDRPWVSAEDHLGPGEVVRNLATGQCMKCHSFERAASAWFARRHQA